MKLNVETKVIHEVKGIDLTLTPKQAMALAIVCSYVSGDESNSLRKETDAIYQGLKKLGVNDGVFDYLFDQVRMRFAPNPTDIEERTNRMLVEVASTTVESCDSYTMQENIRLGNRIAWIKEFRERMFNAGKPQGLKESKDECDRRCAEYKARSSW
jgi:hypothetical protein